LAEGVNCPAIKDLVAKMRDLAVDLHRNDGHRNIFLACQLEAKIAVRKVKRYCITRWNGLFFTVESLLHNEKALALYWRSKVKGAKKYLITDMEWLIIEQLYVLLNLFNTVIESLQNDQNCTISLIISMVLKLRATLTNTTLPNEEEQDLNEEQQRQRQTVEGIMQEVKQAMLNDFTTRWPDNFEETYLIATLLDPRSKHHLKHLDNEQADRAKKLVTDLVANFELMPQEEDSDHAQQESTGPLKRLRLDDILGFDPNPTSQSQTSELDRYMALQIYDRNFNVFEWWRVRQDEFPTLSTIAFNHLSVPASSAVVERAFSRTRTVVNERNVGLTKHKGSTKCFLKLNYDLVSECTRGRG
jgi:hypothetical protein